MLEKNLKGGHGQLYLTSLNEDTERGLNQTHLINTHDINSIDIPMTGQNRTNASSIFSMKHKGAIDRLSKQEKSSTFYLVNEVLNNCAQQSNTTLKADQKWINFASDQISEIIDQKFKMQS